MDIGQGFAQMGAGIADAMGDYHKEHEKYDQQEQLATALSRLGINEQGNLVPIDSATGAGGTGKAKIQPIIDPKALELFTARTAKDRAKATGALEALSKMAIHGAQTAISSAVEDKSLSGQRTKQIMDQSTTAFPTEQAQREATLAHTKSLTDQAGKVEVKGFGFMTPDQASKHYARQERITALQQKTEPALKFDTSLQNDFGLTTDAVLKATQGKFPSIDESGKPKTGADGKPMMNTGVPLVDIAGNQVGLDSRQKLEDGSDNPSKGKYVNQYGAVIDNPTAKSPTVWAVVGPNAVHVPVDQWSQIVSKSKAFNDSVQATKILSKLKNTKQEDLTDKDQIAFKWATGILGK